MGLSEKPDIEYLTKLARMELTEDEKATLEKDLDAVIGYMNTLSKIDTEDVEPMEHVLGLSNVLREDNILPSLDRDTLLNCAPKAEDGFYDVPIAVE